jgi:hypothetical protein
VPKPALPSHYESSPDLLRFRVLAGDVCVTCRLHVGDLDILCQRVDLELLRGQLGVFWLYVCHVNLLVLLTFFSATLGNEVQQGHAFQRASRSR